VPIDETAPLEAKEEALQKERAVEELAHTGVSASIEDARETESPSPEPPLDTSYEGKSTLKAKLTELYKWLFTEGNIWVSLGVLFFLVGFSLMFKLAYDTGYLTVGMALFLSAAVGVIMTAFGWDKRNQRRTFALVLQGGGIGLLYLTTFAYRKLIPNAPADACLIFMLALTVLTAVLAVRQDFQPLALAAIIAGFLTPIFMSTGSNNFVALFTLYSILNVEILILSYFRDWFLMRWVGLLASSVMAFTWGILRFVPDDLRVVEPFIILFFFVYIGISLIPLYKLKRGFIKEGDSKGLTKPDQVMLVSLPFIVLALELSVCYHTRYGQALSSLALGIVYFVFYMLVRKDKDALALGYKPKLLLLLAVLFVNLAIPLYLTVITSSSIWALEGALLMVYAHYFYQEKDSEPLPLIFAGVALEAASGVLFYLVPLFRESGANITFSPFVDKTSSIISLYLMAVAAYISVWVFKEIYESSIKLKGFRLWYFELRLDNTSAYAWIFALYGAISFTLASVELDVQLSLMRYSPGAFFFLALGAVLGLIVGALKPNKYKSSPFLALSVVPYFQVAIFTINACFYKLSLNVLSVAFASRPIGFVLDLVFTPSWNLPALILMLVFSGIFIQRRKAYSWFQILFDILLFGSACYLGMFLEGLVYSFENRSFMFFLPALVLGVTLSCAKRQKVPEGVKKAAHVALLFFLMINIFLFFYLGSQYYIPEGFTSLPILNSLDGFQILYIVAAILFFRACKDGSIKNFGEHYLVPTLGFLWLNCLALRVAFEYFHERVHLSRIAEYPYFNGILAIIWGAAALTLIFYGKSRKSRGHWFMGAGLLGLDLVKLFVIDLRNTPTLLRVIAFLLMGATLMLIGWMAPLPPREKNAAKSV
jgi:hypothetical protein